MTRARTQGFTLVEAAVAMGLVVVLSGIIVPLVVKNLNDSQNSRARSDVQIIAAAIASQIRDTGRRPSAAGGPGASDGSGQATWQSGGAAPIGFPASLAANTFTNLFTFATGTPAANALFGTSPGSEFCYKGPYLAGDAAIKSDPWGRAYVILGYNAISQTHRGPIWIACAGPDKTFLPINLTPVGAAPALIYPGTWTHTKASSDDIVACVN